jgi:hypothetical protein
MRRTGGTAVGDPTRSSPFCLANGELRRRRMMPLRARVVDDADFADANAFVDPRAVISAGLRRKR